MPPSPVVIILFVRSHGRLETHDYFSSMEYMDYITIGYNFRMSNIIAALGIAQLKKIDKVIAMRRKNAEYLTARLKQETPEITTPNHLKDYYHVYQMYTINANNYRDELAKYLADSGIMTKVYFSPTHLTHFYKNKLGYTCKLPVTEKISEQVLTLPMYPTLTMKETDFIIDKIKSFFVRVR